MKAFLQKRLLPWNLLLGIIKSTMKDIAIFGAGGFGKEVACLIRSINENLMEPQWRFVGFFDDGVEKNMQVSHFGKCLGNITDLNNWQSQLDLCIAIGNGSTIERIVGKIVNPMIEFPNVIHPNFSLVDEEGFKIGRGNIIQGGCCVTTDVTIGDFNVLNGSVVLSHDDIIGNYNSFMPGTRISGEVKIGNNNFFGVNSVVLQQIRINNNVRLGAGSVLMTKPKDGSLYLGIPATRMKL